MPGHGIGAKSPIRPLKFYIPPNSPAPTQATPAALDDGSDGWDGLASTFGSTAVAIASWAILCAGMTAAAQPVYQQDELPQPPAATIVDDMPWTNPVPSAATPWNLQPQIAEPDAIPSVVDEVYWQPAVQWSEARNAQPLPADVDYVPPPAATVVDEIAWQDTTPLAQPQWNTQLAQFDADYIPRISVDEIPWVNPVAPVIAGPNAQPPTSLDPDYLPQITVDELYWQNPVYPIAAGPNAQPPVGPDADYIPRIAVSDDVWTAGQQWPVAPISQQSFIDTESLAPTVAPIVDELYWQPQAPWPLVSFARLPLIDEVWVPPPPPSTTSFVIWISIT